MTIDDIDFAQLYRDHMKAAGGRRKPPEERDRRAACYADKFGSRPNAYVTKFIELAPHGDCETLLDVGCGPGAIALALAPSMSKVFGLDYSPAMLARMEAAAAAAGLKNVSGILRSWEDDWSDIPACDLVVASRSTAVMDLDAALKKLDAQARRRVCLTSPVGGRHIPPEIFEALGRRRRRLVRRRPITFTPSTCCTGWAACRGSISSPIQASSSSLSISRRWSAPCCLRSAN